MEISSGKEIVAWLGIIFAAALSALGIRKRFWKDNVENTDARNDTTGRHDAVIWWKDEAQTQRQRADKAISDLNQAMLELGGLRARAETLRMEIDVLRDLVDALRREILSFNSKGDD